MAEPIAGELPRPFLAAVCRGPGGSPSLHCRTSSSAQGAAWPARQRKTTLPWNLRPALGVSSLPAVWPAGPACGFMDARVPGKSASCDVTRILKGNEVSYRFTTGRPVASLPVHLLGHHSLSSKVLSPLSHPEGCPGGGSRGLWPGTQAGALSLGAEWVWGALHLCKPPFPHPQTRSHTTRS